MEMTLSVKSDTRFQYYHQRVALHSIREASGIGKIFALCDICWDFVCNSVGVPTAVYSFGSL